MATVATENLTQRIEDITLEDVCNDEDNVQYNIASYLGQSFLHPEHKSTLLEILRCAVCLEVPKIKANLQIKCCKFGHHFCTFCHEKLKNCAICRGTLENGRNFVVEEIMMKLGRDFGLGNSISSDPANPPAWPKGKFQCPHCKTGKFPSVQLLPHMREKHKNSLHDKLRTNPNTKWFQYNLTFPYTPKARHVFSFHVSDMGLLTFGAILPDAALSEPVQVWVQALNKAEFLYQVVFTTESKQFFGISDQKVLNYAEADNGSLFGKIETHHAFKPGENLEFSVTVHTSGIPRPDKMQKSMFWKAPTVFASDRRSRRTIGRNKRRANLRARYREIAQNKTETESIDVSQFILF